MHQYSSRAGGAREDSVVLISRFVSRAALRHLPPRGGIAGLEECRRAARVRSPGRIKLPIRSPTPNSHSSCGGDGGRSPFWECVLCRSNRGVQLIVRRPRSMRQDFLGGRIYHGHGKIAVDKLPPIRSLNLFIFPSVRGREACHNHVTLHILRSDAPGRTAGLPIQSLGCPNTVIGLSAFLPNHPGRTGRFPPHSVICSCPSGRQLSGNPSWVLDGRKGAQR